ncbi:MAG TPA: Gfo/Idh/MocA family oxidoreductase [Candidatus Lambdaproteobacteria bacterium]|jgi:predicted dehydrogenase|nr:Gfo/Idh/MocA family oxidoreductase [Candidatus Lambdaproteobacteria bacterium]
MPLKLGVLGIDHGHIFGMLSNMKAQGCTCEAYWTDGPAVTEEKFNTVFSDVQRVDDRRRILDDPDVSMVLISAVPADRSKFAIEAMEAGKDVMVDKPGCTTLEQLAEIREVQARTGRIWTVNFSERFEVPAVTRADEMVQAGAIGRVIQTVGLAPHKQNLATRPDWYFKRERFGGILCDIGSHQIDQFLYFTGSETADIAHALVENTTMPEQPEFQDFGEIVLKSGNGHGYIRVDWFTPNGLPTWGDGRLFLQGTDGQIELRKYTDIGRPHVTNTLFLVNDDKNEMIPCEDAGLPYFPRLIADVQERTETAVGQSHTYTTTELSIRAQMIAEGITE